jgi:hypothetical protein
MLADELALLAGAHVHQHRRTALHQLPGIARRRAAGIGQGVVLRPAAGQFERRVEGGFGEHGGHMVSCGLSGLGWLWTADHSVDNGHHRVNE